MTYTMTNDSITVIHGGAPFVVRKGQPNFVTLRAALIEERWDDVPSLLTVPNSLEKWAQGRFKVDGDVVSYDGERLPTELNQRIIEMASKNEDPSCIFKFWERLQRNPSSRSVNQLWSFLKHQGIPLTPDGTFLAYKGVNSDFTDKHTGTVDNTPGAVNEMPRNKISDDPNEGCHFGYHVGALEYAQPFAAGGRVVVCEVDPEHVVCIPYDEGYQKMRVCKYKVIGNYSGTQMPSTSVTDEYRATETVETEDVDGDACDSENDGGDPPCVCGQPKSRHNTDSAMGATCLPEDGSSCWCQKFEPAITETETQELTEKAEAMGNDGPLNQEPVEEDKSIIKAPRGFARIHKMSTLELMKQTLDDLRKYASAGLKIVGAYHIPGGKAALVAIIDQVRGAR